MEIIRFMDGYCPKCGGMTHGYNDGPMVCSECGAEYGSSEDTELAKEIVKKLGEGKS